MCAECFDLMAVAALPVVQAASALSIDCSAPALHAALQRGWIIVLAQGVMSLS